MYKVEVTPVVGLPQFTGWSHVAASHARFGHLVCAFAVKGEHAGNVGRDLTEIITEFTVNSATDFHQLLTKLSDTATELDAEVSVAAGFFSAHTLIIGALRGSVFLKREQRMGVLLTAANDIKVVEGKRQTGDIVVLSTLQGQAVLPEVELRFKTGFDVDSVIASIIPGLHSNQDSSLSSLAFVTGGQELEEVPETEEAPIAIELDDQPAVAHSRLEESAHEPLVEISSDEPVESEQEIVEQSTAQSLIAVVPPMQSLTPRGKAIPVGELLVRLRTVIGLFVVGLRQIIMAIIHWFVKTFRQLRFRDVYVQGQSPRKVLRVVLPIVLGILLVGGLLAWWLLTTRSQVKAAETAVAADVERLTAARQTLNTDPLKAREETQAVIADLQQLEQQFTQKKAGQKVITKQLNEAKTFFESISGVEAVQELEVFYDLRLVDSSFVATSVDAYGDNVVFLDKDRKKLVILSVSTKQAREVSLDGMDRVSAVAVDEKNVTLLGNGVFQVPLANGSTVTKVIDEGDSNRTSTQIETFASYIYVLNADKRNIYRYSKGTDKFSDPIGWVSGAVSLDFAQVNSWAIDGQVWIATKDGQVHLLESGREQPFEIKGLEKKFEHPLVVYTRDGFSKLYVLEANTQRVVVLNKDGSFIKEVSSPSLASATGLFVDEASNTAYAVSGSIIYAVKL